MADIFSTKRMLQMIEEGNLSTYAWLRDRYFANHATFDTKTVEFDLVGKGDRKIAPFVNPRVGGQAVDRQGFRTLSYEAPEVSPLMVTTAEDLMNRMPGENPYSTRSPAERAAEQLGQDLAKLDEIITRREEVMCAEALFSGKVTVKGIGYDEVVDYWKELGAEKPETTLTTKWDASSTTAKQIAKDLRDLRLNMIQTSGFTPTELVMGQKVCNTILDKLLDASMLDMRRVDVGKIEPQHLPQGVTYWGHLKDSALDLYSYDNWYYDEETDTEVAMVPEDKALLASPNVRTTLAYGGCGLIGPKNNVTVVRGERIPDSWVQRAAPAGRIVQIKSRPLPIIQQVLGFHVVNPLTA